MVGGLGITFRRLANEVITAVGLNDELPPEFFVAAFKPDGTGMKITAPAKGNPTTAPGKKDNLLPTPCDISMARDTVYAPIKSGGSQSEAPRRRPPLPPAPESPPFQPDSPTSEQLAERSPERHHPGTPIVRILFAM